MSDLIHVDNLVKHFPVRGGLLSRVVAKVHAVNGVSLTVAALRTGIFETEIIPLTLKDTNLASLRRAQEVNLECDIIGKYVYNWTVKK